KRRVNYVRLESPDNFIFARASVAVTAAYGGQQGRKARVGDYHEMLIRTVVVGMQQSQRVETRVWIPTAKDFVERVSLAYEEESPTSCARKLAESSLLTIGPLSGERQALDHQRAEVVLQNYVLKIAMQLGNRRMRATNGRKLTRVLRKKCVVKRIHLEAVPGDKNKNFALGLGEGG
ncbi:MAG: hypothetical protein DMF70_11770, partial [Acidobacteria bacterium]